MTLVKRFALLCALSCCSLAAYAAPTIVTVHAQTVEEIIAAMLSANTSGQPTLIKVKAGEYDLSAVPGFASEFGPSAFPPVTGTIYIDGKGAASTVFNGGGNVIRLFTVLPGGKLGVSDATISNGYAFCGDPYRGSPDDCIPFGGGAMINIEGVVWLEHCVLTGNHVVSYDGYGNYSGGAISSIRGNLHLLDTTVSGNTAGPEGGGGLLLVGGTTTIERSTIRENWAGPGIGNGGWVTGGGIHITGGDLYIANSTIVDNRASETTDDEWVGFGAGLYSGGASVKIIDSAVINNSAEDTGAGGGIYNAGQMTLRNVTVSGNSAGSRGGGIYNGGTLKMQGITIANNTVHGTIGFPPDPLYPDDCFQYENEGKPCLTGGGGLWNPTGATVQMSNTVIANNVLENTVEVHVGSDCYGAVVSKGFNAIKNPIDCTLQNSHNDLTNLKVRLGGLEDNGKAGHAHLPLLSNSPLIDAGGKVFEQCSARDQIGNRRADGNQDGVTRCDIGAIEFQPDR